MILDEKHALQQKLFREFAETEFTKELQEKLDLTGACLPLCGIAGKTGERLEVRA